MRVLLSFDRLSLRSLGRRAAISAIPEKTLAAANHCSIMINRNLNALVLDITLYKKPQPDVVLRQLRFLVLDAGIYRRITRLTKGEKSVFEFEL